eukprot:CAMPEP_0119269310 /NCGR_PEP_ID=MMETSP1329-20130426/6772_1 /TAXON_ID=114041 /ORGANISM="Genus nov. species nov., Strain RCC1024" /LENGTH=225 /DNA_ID=CAMNT_0007269307 /DNA_START=114 /DNA_END=791 /DNA_ORIENTATION=+
MVLRVAKLTLLLCSVSSSALTRHAAPRAARTHTWHAKLAARVAAAALAVSLPAARVSAFGPENIELSNVVYEDTGKKVGEICAGRPLKAPGEKVARGLLPKCVKVTATATSGAKKPVKDAAVYGYVKTATGDSAIANNPDFRSDAGQFAMIKLVPPGSETVDFEFVAVIPDKDIGAEVGQLGKLTFDSLKAISYPGGARMATFTACEMDSLSDACDEEQEKFISK